MTQMVERNYAQTYQYQWDTNQRGQYATIQLFNGHNLDGWYTFLQDSRGDNDPKEVFTIKDGLLGISGEEWGCITTNNYMKIIGLSLNTNGEG